MIIPVYRVEKHLKNCLDSIIDETLSDYEIILVDDGSPDGSGKICDEYSEKYGFVRTIHKPNGGLADARNAGLEASRGEYIVFADSDDSVGRGYISYIFDVTRQPADIFALSHFTDYTETNSRNERLIEDAANLSAAEAVRRLERAGLFNYAWNKIYSKKMLDKPPKAVYNKGSEPGEDLLFNADCFSRAKTGTLCSKPFYHWMRRGEDTLANRFRADLNERNKSFIRCRCELYRALGIYDSDFDLLSDGNLAYIFSGIPNMYRKGNRFPRKKRLDFFREVISSGDVKQWIAAAKPSGTLMKHFVRLVKLKSPRLTDAYYSVAMGLRNRLDKTWTKSRKRVGA